MTQFYDAATWENIPKGGGACLYGDGLYKVPPGAAQALNLAHVRYITVTGNGQTCSIIDGRPDNNITAAQVRGFVRERRGRDMHAIIYTPRSWVAEYVFYLRDYGAGRLDGYGKLMWWISTLDGKPWTAAELSADLKGNWDADIAEGAIWACQNQGGPAALYDTSVLYRDW
jgi:hypothetical protein